MSNQAFAHKLAHRFAYLITLHKCDLEFWIYQTRPAQEAPYSSPGFKVGVTNMVTLHGPVISGGNDKQILQYLQIKRPCHSRDTAFENTLHPIDTRIAPPCECYDCRQQYRTLAEQDNFSMQYWRQFSQESAQSLLDKFLQQTREAQKYLRNALQLHGDSLLRKWKKSKPEKKRQIMLKAREDIQVEQWIPMQGRRSFPTQDEADRLRITYLLPFLNLESLQSSPMKLLSLINHRALHEFQEWLPFDMQQTDTAWKSGILATDYCECCVDVRSQDFGKVVPWDQADIQTRNIVGYPRAALAFEAQSTLMCFLRDVVKEILGGIETATLASKWTVLVASGFRLSHDTEAMSSFANEAFCAPPVFTIHHLVDLSRARLADVQDRVWLLQTDPSYMHDYISSIRDSEICAHLDLEGKYFQAGNHISRTPIHRLALWKGVVEESEHVQEVLSRVADLENISILQHLQRLEALSCFTLLLISMLNTTRLDIFELIPRLSRFNGLYTSEDQSLGKILWTAKAMTQSEAFDQHRLFWCLLRLVPCETTADWHELDSPTLCNIIDDCLANDPQSKKGVSPLEKELMDRLSDMAALFEMFHAVKYRLPSIFTLNLEQAYEISRGRILWRYIKHEGPLKESLRPQLETDVFGPCLQRLNQTRMPSGRRDLLWLQRVTLARENLRAFWDEVRNSLKEIIKKIGLPEADATEHISWISYDLAPEYLEAVAKEREAVLAPRLKNKGHINTHVDLESSHPFINDETPSSAISLAIREKVKTRPQQLPDQSEGSSPPRITQQSQEAPDLAIPSKQILVDATDFEIFARMYPASAEEHEEGLTDWRAFVRAMQAAGFAASQSGGSAVTFVNEEGRIVFHKPHPVAKIDQKMLMTHGKRLGRWFGWSRETFACT